MSMENWVEKYRPKTLKEVVGNRKAIEQLVQWALEWERKKASEIKKKAAVLDGRPGVGKTSAALALANDFGWDVIELNASDVRNEQQIKKIVTSGVRLQAIGADGKLRKRKLIVLDEADNLYEARGKMGDRGGKKAIVEAIKITQQPIILIANDSYQLFSGYYGSILKGLCEIIKFNRLRQNEVIAVLKRICAAEGIKYDYQALKIIAARAMGDLRAAINDLQSVAEGKKFIGVDDVNALGYRDEWKNIYEGVLRILHTESFLAAKDILRKIDEDPDYILLWIEENVPLEYTKPEDLARAYEYISRADVFLGRVFRRQYYGLWRNAMDMIAAVSVAKDKKYEVHPKKYSFPSWLKIMNISKERRESRKKVTLKLGRYLHTSSNNIAEDIVYYGEIMKRMEKIGVFLTKKLHLSDKELMCIFRDAGVVERILNKTEDLEKFE